MLIAMLLQIITTIEEYLTKMVILDFFSKCLMSRSCQKVIPYFDLVESLSSFLRVKVMDIIALYKCNDF